MLQRDPPGFQCGLTRTLNITGRFLFLWFFFTVHFTHFLDIHEWSHYEFTICVTVSLQSVLQHSEPLDIEGFFL